MAGKWNRRSSDNCSYQQEVIESTAPIDYMLYSGAHRNCGLCCSKNDCCSEKSLKDEQSKTQTSRVEMESNLMNINRLSSKCSDLKHKPSDYDKDYKTPCLQKNELPCYNWSNGLPRVTTTGYQLPNSNCQKN